jgi:hypothetical protein
MHLKYLHYFGNESSESLLEAYGIIPKDRQTADVLGPKQCPNCNEPNILVILIVTFSLMSAGVFKDNMTIGIVAFAKKSKGSSGGSSGGDGGDNGCCCSSSHYLILSLIMILS